MGCHEHTARSRWHPGETATHLTAGGILVDGKIHGRHFDKMHTDTKVKWKLRGGEGVRQRFAAYDVWPVDAGK